MTAIEWLELACNKLGAPIASYAPYYAIKELEDRIQEVTKILHEVLVLLKKENGKC